MNVGNLQAYFRLDSTQFMSAIKSSQASLATLSGAVKTVGAAIVGVFAFSKLKGLYDEAIHAASEQEDAISKLNLVLANSGQYSKKYSDELQSVAGALQDVTRFGDDAVTGLQSQLIAFGAQPENINRITRAALDLAAGMGKELPEAGVLFQKALDGNFTALNKLGFHVDANINDQEKLAQVLKKVEQRFGGAAAAAGDTYAGKIAQLKNAFGDFLEELGNLIIKSPVVIEFLGYIKEKLKELTAWVIANQASLMAWIDALGQGVKAGMRLIKDALVPITENARKMISVFGELDFSVKGLLNNFGSFQKVMLLFSLSVVGAVYDISKAIAESFGDGSMLGGVFRLIQSAMESLIKTTVYEIEALGGITKKTGEAAKSFASLEKTIVNAEQPMLSFQKGLSSFNADGLKKAEEILKNLETPLEKFQAQFRQMEELQRDGFLTSDEAAKVFLSLKKNIEDYAETLKDVNGQEQAHIEKLQEAISLTKEMLSPQEIFNDEMERLNSLSEIGAINFDTWYRASERAKSAFSEATRKMADDSVSDFDRIMGAIDRVASGMENRLTEAFVDLGKGMLDFKSFAISVLEEIQREIIRVFIVKKLLSSVFGESGSGGGLLGSIIGAISGVSTGASLPTGSLTTNIPGSIGLGSGGGAFTTGAWTPTFNDRAGDRSPTVNMTVVTQDANSFMQNRGSILTAMNQAARRGGRNL